MLYEEEIVTDKEEIRVEGKEIEGKEIKGYKSKTLKVDKDNHHTFEYKEVDEDEGK